MFYEINPNVIDIAQTYFTYLKESLGECRIVPGDARISLERELKANPAGNQFDVLALDAFTGDAIPIHLLTREAFELYWHHLRPDGILAINITNRHLDLSMVIRGLAGQCGKQFVTITNDENEKRGVYKADWALVTGNKRFLDLPEVRGRRESRRCFHADDGLGPINTSNLVRVLNAF